MTAARTAASLDFEEELQSPQFLTDPYAIYDRMRRDAPVYWSSGLHAWVVTGHAPLATVLRLDGRAFSTAGRVAAAISRLPSDVQAELPTIRRHYAVGLMHTDPPDHTRIRALVNRLFTPRSVELLGPRIDELANELLDAAGGSRPIDLVAEFALPLSSRVVSEVLGVPLEHSRLKDWIENSQSFLSGNVLTPAVAARMEATLVAARTFIAETADRRRSDPRDDLISRLVVARDEGALTDDELLSTCMTFILGAYMTTTALISSAVLALLSHPSELARMLSDDALLATAVEEVLRYESPAPRITRIASDDVDLDGQRIGRGDSLILMLGAANRDPDVFPEPVRFDIARRANRHLAFAAGANFCAGAPLARLEGASALRALFQRFPRTALAAGFRPAWVANPSIRLVESLQVNLA